MPKCEKCSSGTWIGFEQGNDCPGCGQSAKIGMDETFDNIPKPTLSIEEIIELKKAVGEVISREEAVDLKKRFNL